MNRPGAPLLSAEQHELAATARPWAENLLHTHADQRGRRDVVGLGTSLAGATLRFGDSEPGFGTATTYTFGTLLRAGDRTQHLVSNLNRHGEGSGTRHHLCGVHPMDPGSGTGIGRRGGAPPRVRHRRWTLEVHRTKGAA